MTRSYLLTRAQWCDGIAWQAKAAGSLLRRLYSYMPENVLTLVEAARETDLGRGIVIELRVDTTAYLWPLFAWLHEYVGPVRQPVQSRQIVFGDPATERGAVRVVWT